MKDRLSQIKMLENDTMLKEQFITSLNRAKPSMGIHTIEQYWRHVWSTLTTEIGKLQPDYTINWQSIKATALLSAEYGLSFEVRAKELYWEVHVSPESNTEVMVDLGLKYNGMKHRLVKACGVRMLTTEVVYENDTFEWRGQWKEPLYIMANDESEMACCFGMVKLKSGDTMAYKLSKAEMDELARQDIERATQLYGNPNSSFYNSPYRKRMFEIATLRYLYRELISLFDSYELEEAQAGNSEQQVLAAAFQEELNRIAG